MATTDTVNRAALPNGREGRALQKGQQTKATIIDAALALAAQIGLEGLSIGALAGYSLETGPEALTLTLVWNPTQTPEVDYRVFVHLSDESGHIWSQSNGIPAEQARPTTGWVAGEYIVDQRILLLPPEMPPGTYRLWVGLFDAETLQRAQVSGPGAAEDGRLDLGRAVVP